MAKLESKRNDAAKLALENVDVVANADCIPKVGSRRRAVVLARDYRNRFLVLDFQRYVEVS